MWKGVFIAGLAGCLLTSLRVASGQGVTDSYSDTYHKCIDQAGNTNAILTCAGAEKDRWDVRLNKAYNDFMTSDSFSAETKRRLREAQQLWTIFQDRSCDADAALEIGSGTGFSLAKAGCTLQMVVQRTLELEGISRASRDTSANHSPAGSNHSPAGR